MEIQDRSPWNDSKIGSESFKVAAANTYCTFAPNLLTPSAFSPYVKSIKCLTSSANPLESISSHSSTTKCLRRPNNTHSSFAKANKRAGVHIKTSARRNSGMASSKSPMILFPFFPAFVVVEDLLATYFRFRLFVFFRCFKLVGFNNFFSLPKMENTVGAGNSKSVRWHQIEHNSAIFETCLANSTFGTRMTIAGQHLPLTFVPPLPGAATWDMSGKVYANVFPEPVSANITAEFPSMSSGVANFWISVGLFKPALFKFSAVMASKPALTNALSDNCFSLLSSSSSSLWL